MRYILYLEGVLVDQVQRVTRELDTTSALALDQKRILGA